MHFEMKQPNYIVCPKCKNDTSFYCFGDKIDDGIYEIRIGCSKCDYVSDELYEECGYEPDLSLDAIRYHVKSLHGIQQETSMPKEKSDAL